MVDSVFSLNGFESVVPFRHDAVRSDAQLSHLGVGDLDAGLVGLAHEVGAHTQSGGGAGGAQVVQDRLVAVEGAARPVLADFAEQALFDAIPLRRRGRLVGHGHATRRSRLQRRCRMLNFQARAVELLLPPPSARICRLWACG